MSRETTLKVAKQALERGAYRECLSILNLLLESDSLQSEKGGEIGTIMITALIGQGETQTAISICEILSKHQNDSIRQQAKQYISVLNSPSLERPDNWSVKIPNLSINSNETSVNLSHNKAKRKIQAKSPPTGPTKYLSIGYILISSLIFGLLTILLSGCVEFNTEIDIKGPDRIEMCWEIDSNSDKLIPWQENINSPLKTIHPKVSISTNTNKGVQMIKSTSLSSREANTILQDIGTIAAESADFKAPNIELNLDEKNWLIGIEQRLNLNVDLTEIPEIPGLKINVLINSFPKKASPKSSPLLTDFLNEKIKWPLKVGSINNLSLHKWQWNRIGIGTIFILLLMIFSMLLQYLRLQMGLGFPELPP